jgi:acyl dehydratase
MTVPHIAAGLNASKLEVGQTLPVLVKHPTTRQLVMYAGASGDFYEIHYDTAFAQDAGLDGVIVHGLLKVAWLGELVSSWAGPNSMIRTLEASYRGTDVPASDYRLNGTVTSVESEGESSTLVGLELWGESEDGTRTTLGTASVEV